ncbi:ATPase AAA [Luteibacter yeojuensis]|uniref:ATPase AAA n=1 Tax=Luteibacter yeojuensis TaxID=345309 RepID=A0A0F3KXN9_9GAMM|nr:ATPase AAA [Luteibacter yeojuensis]KJV35712.1 ATPase AAA [Luteibacter yeojuensis]
MTYTPSLADLGPRICVLGPSNSGKSTLADAMGRALDLDVVHLDQLHHLPHTAWRPRPRDEFHALHDAAIDGDRWVIDGNYSSCMPQRLARATGVVLLDVSTLTSLRRYLWRTWFGHRRVGGLDGARERVHWAMLRHVVFATPANRRRYAAMFEQLPMPKVRLASVRAIHAAYAAWRLPEPRPDS